MRKTNACFWPLYYVQGFFAKSHSGEGGFYFLPSLSRRRRIRWKYKIWSHNTREQTGEHFCSRDSWNCSRNEFFSLLTKRVLTKRVFFCAHETSAHENEFFCLLTKRVLTKRVLFFAHETSFFFGSRFFCSRFFCSWNECSRNEFKLVSAEHWER